MVCANCKAELKCGNNCCKNPPPNFKYVDSKVGIVQCSECGYTQHEDTFHDDTEALKKMEDEMCADEQNALELGRDDNGLY